jgi:hypothetical protein
MILYCPSDAAVACVAHEGHYDAYTVAASGAGAGAAGAVTDAADAEDDIAVVEGTAAAAAYTHNAVPLPLCAVSVYVARSEFADVC